MDFMKLTQVKSVRKVSLALLMAVAVGFVGCGDKEDKNAQEPTQTTQQGSQSQSLALKVQSQDELISMLKLMSNEARFYAMSGEIGGEPSEAYVWIGKNAATPNEYSISITLPGQFNETYALNDYVDIPLSKVELGLDSDMLVIKGKWDTQEGGLEASKMKDKDFAFKQNAKLLANEIDLITGSFQSSQKGEKGEDISYTHSITQAFIPENTMANNIRESLNLALNNGAKDKQALAQSLATQTKDSFDKLIKDGGGLLFHTEYSNDIKLAYVDEKFIIFKQFDYSFEGGAHGNTIYSTRAFSLVSGKELSNKLDHVLNMQKKDALLTLLDKKLEGKKDELFPESLPLQTLPDVFSFDSLGMVLEWSPYSIAPYSSGVIRIHVPFGELKEFLRADSEYAPLFK